MIVSGYRVHKWKIWNTEFTRGTSGYKAVWESGINSEDGAVSLFRFRSNTSGWWGKLKKSVRELSLKECLSFFLTLDYMCQYNVCDFCLSNEWVLKTCFEYCHDWILVVALLNGYTHLVLFEEMKYLQVKRKVHVMVSIF